jgi:hypothetical protein
VAAPAPAGWEEPDWTIINDRRGALPDFPTDALPDCSRTWLNRAAHGAGVTVGHVAIPLLSIAAGLIGTARRVGASRSWSEPITLWTAIVGNSGTGKTPGLDVTKRALSSIERDRKGKVGEQRFAHEIRCEAAKTRLKQWKDDVKAAIEAKQPPPQKPADASDPGEFIAPRLYVSNATVERLSVLLQARPCGMQVIADELAGLFLNMSRYSGGQDNEFWLEAWNGKHFVVERMGRPAVAVDHLLIGVTGGFQPDKLARSFKGDMDGMYARIMFAWPEEPGYRPLSNDVDEFDPDLVNALTRLTSLGEGEETFAPRLVPLSDEAVEEFEQFRQFLHAGKYTLEGREREWWAKGASHVIRLAGALSLLSWAWNGGPEPNRIDASFVRSAVKLVKEYFWAHARAALRQIGLTERHNNVRKLVKWMIANRKTQISVMDARRDALGGTIDAKQTEELLASLVEAGFLRKETTPSGSKGGKPIHRWDVNPKIAAQTAETAQTSGSSAASGGLCS